MNLLQRPPPPRPERLVEYVLFTSRWLLAPIYLGLIAGLAVLLVKFVQHTIELVTHVLTANGDDAIVGVLGLIDLALMGSLVVMVMFAGYENFVSKLELVGHKDKPSWMGHVDFSDLKLKLMASIVAISAIQVLENFMNLAHLSDRELAWSVGIHMTFVASGVLLAVMDRLSGKVHRATGGPADGGRLSDVTGLSGVHRSTTSSVGVNDEQRVSG
jgi:uncharacterized protein (TIGR00645 family)